MNYGDLIKIDEAAASQELRFPSISERQLEQFARQAVAIKENLIRDMLGQWVSEIEPVVYYAKDGSLEGIGWEGAGPIIRVPSVVQDVTFNGKVLYRHHISGVLKK